MTQTGGLLFKIFEQKKRAIGARRREVKINVNNFSILS